MTEVSYVRLSEDTQTAPSYPFKPSTFWFVCTSSISDQTFEEIFSLLWLPHVLMSRWCMFAAVVDTFMTKAGTLYTAKHTLSSNKQQI